MIFFFPHGPSRAPSSISWKYQKSDFMFKFHIYYGFGYEFCIILFYFIPKYECSKFIYYPQPSSSGMLFETTFEWFV